MMTLCIINKHFGLCIIALGYELMYMSSVQHIEAYTLYIHTISINTLFLHPRSFFGKKKTQATAGDIVQVSRPIQKGRGPGRRFVEEHLELLGEPVLDGRNGRTGVWVDMPTRLYQASQRTRYIVTTCLRRSKATNGNLFLEISRRKQIKCWLQTHDLPK